MITDTLEHASHYYGVSPGIKQALEYLAATDFDGVEPGRYDIDGDSVYALVQEYDTRPDDKGLWEAHRRYIDVQYVAAGIEAMGYAPIGTMTESQAYDEKDDYTLFRGNGVRMTMPAGSFAVFFPQDVHMPCMAIENPTSVRKVVVKIAVS